MKKSVAKLILSWMVLIVGVTAVFLLRNHFGIISLEDAKPTITTVKTNKEGSVGIWWDCYNTTVTSYNIYKVKVAKILAHQASLGAIIISWIISGIGILSSRSLCS